MDFSPEITLGNILSIVAFSAAVLGAFYGLKSKLEVFSVIVQQYNERFARMELRHEQRLTKLEENNQQLTVMVQQLIGRSEEHIRWHGEERRERQRRTQ